MSSFAEDGALKRAIAAYEGAKDSLDAVEIPTARDAPIQDLMWAWRDRFMRAAEVDRTARAVHSRITEILSGDLPSPDS